MVPQRISTSTPIHLSCAFKNSDFSRLGADLAHFDPKWMIQNLGQWEGTVVPYLPRYWFPLEPSVWYMDEVRGGTGHLGELIPQLVARGTPPYTQMGSWTKCRHNEVRGNATLQRLMFETDGPYMAVPPFRSKIIAHRGGTGYLGGEGPCPEIAARLSGHVHG